MILIQQAHLPIESFLKYGPGSSSEGLTTLKKFVLFNLFWTKTLKDIKKILSLQISVHFKKIISISFRSHSGSARLMKSRWCLMRWSGNEILNRKTRIPWPSHSKIVKSETSTVTNFNLNFGPIKELSLPQSELLLFLNAPSKFYILQLKICKIQT
jgi:hypothetical protein